MNRILVGVCAGIAAGFVMNQFSRTVTRFTGGREGAGAAPGANRTGRGAQPPQATHDAELDAATKVGSVAFEAVTGHRPSRRERPRLGIAAHYAFSASLGTAYALLRPRVKAISAGSGALYGATVWALADEGAIPALGLSRGPRELGTGVLLYGLAAHLVYGLSLEAAYRTLSGDQPARAGSFARTSSRATR